MSSEPVGPTAIQGAQVLVTGATAGIGKAAAAELARLGASVTILGRDAPRCLNVAADLSHATGNPRVQGLPCDLSSLAAVRDAAKQFKASHSKLDVLILNAGVFLAKRELSVDGYEKTFATRFLGHFLLTELLLPLLEAAGEARIIVTAASPGGFDVDFENVSLENKYSVAKAVTNAMSALVIYAMELSKRYEGKGITANIMHPGFVNTDLFVDMPWLMRIFMRIIGIPPEKGADTLVYLASAPELKGVTGEYFRKRKSRPFRSAITDPARQAKVRQLGIKMAGL
jgi:NAD(P)-dependent dehydrogenase (short-subunit alcohol dehydrogenase family)